MIAVRGQLPPGAGQVQADRDAGWVTRLRTWSQEGPSPKLRLQRVAVSGPGAAS